MNLLDKKINIVTVSASGTRRQLINNALRQNQYENVTGVPDITTLVQLLESSPIDWVLCSASFDEKPHILELLHYARQNHRCGLRFSILTNEVDVELLYAAYGLGLFSHHVGLEAKDTVNEAFTELMQIVEVTQGREDLVAATYCRRLLIEHKNYELLASMESKLLQGHPGSFDLLIRNAEAQFLNNHHEKAQILWAQATTIAPDRISEITDSKISLGAEESEENGRKSESYDTNILGLQRVAIIDPCENDREEIEQFLQQLGVPEIKCFTGPESFKEFLKSRQSIDVIICEWSFKELSGPIFVQQVRDILGASVPITVVNQKLSPSDLPLLREMGVTDRISKPLKQEVFNRELVWIINQERNPTEPEAIRYKLYQAAKNKDKTQMSLLFERYKACPEVKVGDLKTAEAHMSYINGLYLAAKELAVNALREGGHSLDALGILGKAMMKLREFEKALICLENAAVISPKNIERICQIAEANMELGNDEVAKKNLSKAEELNSEANCVVGLKAKSALKTPINQIVFKARSGFYFKLSTISIDHKHWKLFAPSNSQRLLTTEYHKCGSIGVCQSTAL